MNKLNKLLWLFILALAITSCGDDLPIDEQEIGDFSYGYFITNEGPFSGGSGTLTFIGNDNQVVQNAYKNVNNEDLGSIVQSMTTHNDKVYIVVNNSHKIVVANRHTLEKIAVIDGDDINNPRSMVVVDNKGYVSNWGNSSLSDDDFIAVINLTDNTVSSTISVGEGPEDMLVVGSKIYVNLQGGYSQNDKVVIIDTTTNAVSSTITVGDVPNSLVKDSNGAIWVLCGGNPSWSGAETDGKLVKLVNDEVDTTFEFTTMEHPYHLTINSTNLLYTLGGKVYTLEDTTTDLNPTSIDEFEGYYYTIKAHNGMLYTTNAGDFVSEGTHKVFDLSNHTEVNNFATGIIPGSIVF